MITGKPFRVLGFCLVGLASLQGCAYSTTAALEQMGRELIFGTDVNLREKSYAAADYMVHQARSYIDEGDVIQAVPLTNIDAPELSSQLAHIIPAQVGSRLAQLGYYMDLSDVVPIADDSFHVGVGQTEKPNHVLAGTYRILDDGFQVNLRIVEQESSRIISTFDYQIPRSSEVKALAQPEAKIMVIKP